MANYISPANDANLVLNSGETLIATGGPTGGNFSVVDLGPDFAQRGNVRVYVTFTSANFANTDETYFLEAEYAADAAITTAVSTATFPIDASQFAGGGVVSFTTTPTARYIGLTITLGGTLPKLVIDRAGLIDDYVQS
jgi:hypothetical protein